MAASWVFRWLISRAALHQRKGAGGIHRCVPETAFIGQLRQKPDNDEPHRACRFAPSFVGGTQAQSGS